MLWSRDENLQSAIALAAITDVNEPPISLGLCPLHNCQDILPCDRVSIQSIIKATKDLQYIYNAYICKRYRIFTTFIEAPAHGGDD